MKRGIVFGDKMVAMDEGLFAHVCGRVLDAISGDEGVGEGRNEILLHSLHKSVQLYAPSQAFVEECLEKYSNLPSSHIKHLSHLLVQSQELPSGFHSLDWKLLCTSTSKQCPSASFPSLSLTLNTSNHLPQTFDVSLSEFRALSRSIRAMLNDF